MKIIENVNQISEKVKEKILKVFFPDSWTALNKGAGSSYFYNCRL